MFLSDCVQMVPTGTPGSLTLKKGTVHLFNSPGITLGVLTIALGTASLKGK